jgi:hypothetical protein
MGMRSTRSWWASIGLGKGVADDGDDFGDMGTAFGLDATLAGPDDAHPPSGHGALDAEAMPSTADRLKGRSTR